MRAEARPTIVGPVPPHRALPKTPDFPALEQEVLERWRERDIFRESVRRREGAEPFVFYEGPPTANGRPGLPPRAGARVQGHLPPLPDDARALRRAQGRLGLPRPAGRDRGRAEARLHLQGRHRALRHRRVQRAVPRVGVRVPRGLDGADRAHRLLGRPRAPLPHARPRLHRVGVVGAQDDVGEGPAVRGPQGRALLRALRHRAVLPRGRAGLRGRRGPVDLRDVPGHRSRSARCARATGCWRGRRRRGRVLSHAALAVAPDLPYVRTEDGFVLAEARMAAVLGRGRAGRRALPRARTSSARATSRRSTSSRRRSSGPRATPCCPATS